MFTGFGRTGTWFAVEHTGVTPDIMTLGKGLRAGFAVAALASTRTITSAAPWGNPSGSSSSYGANPLASAAVLAATTVIEQDGLVDNAAAEDVFEVIAREGGWR